MLLTTMMDYQIQPISRRCVVTGRELHPGETFFTALIDEGVHFQRLDYSKEGWQGPPAGAFSFWTGTVPPPDDQHKPRFDDDLLMDCFGRLEGQDDPGRVNFRYVVALLLMRRKRLKFEQSITEGGVEKLCLRCPQSGAKHQVVNPRLSEDEMVQVQEEVFKVLGWE